MWQRPGVHVPETSLEEWLRQLTISLWLRVTGRDLPLNARHSRALKRRKNLLGGTVYWSIPGVRSIDINFGVTPLPSDSDEDPIGQELLLACTLWDLPDLERDAVYTIADHLCVTHDLTYGQVGHAGVHPTFAKNPRCTSGGTRVGR